jgi:dTMP kinase
MKRGLFITLEGSDGSGKSTQLQLLQEFLTRSGYSVVVTREPGGTAISEKIRDLLLDKTNSEMTGVTEMLLYAASRSQHVAEVIQPALERGDVVICDRFVDSSIAYQGYARNLGKQVEIINEFATFGCMPDATFLLMLNPELAKTRIGTPKRDRLESEQSEFFSEVARGYKELAKRYPDRIVEIDARRSVEDIHVEICDRVKSVLITNSIGRETE